MNDNFLAKARKLSILSTSLDIFDIRQHYVRILYITRLVQSRNLEIGDKEWFLNVNKELTVHILICLRPPTQTYVDIRETPLSNEDIVKDINDKCGARLENHYSLSIVYCSSNYIY